ncbi:hypothetical protein AS589_04540 [Empedobacter brevis]|uniref:hypothetical protein n=1 Tax=Empedobacter brevis TaxID=247 RepID=UPI0013202224|nr:hypothetical protein [Empedobacter brevis]QHC84107.1 hypothetical protein AS589_04540 [Empedobacter brevis]
MKSLKKVMPVVLFLSIGVFGQESKENIYAEIVTIKNNNLINFIELIDLKKYYLRDGQVWYIDFSKENEIKLASGRISKFIQSDSNIYITIIDNNIIFILSKKDQIIPIKKTGLKADLNRFNIIDLTFELSSYWILKEVNGEIKIVSKSIYNGKVNSQ